MVEEGKGDFFEKLYAHKVITASGLWQDNPALLRRKNEGLLV